MVSKLNAPLAPGQAKPTVGSIYAEIGFGGLWGGLGTRIFMIGTLTALQWLLYDTFKVQVSTRLHPFARCTPPLVADRNFTRASRWDSPPPDRPSPRRSKRPASAARYVSRYPVHKWCLRLVCPARVCLYFLALQPGDCSVSKAGVVVEGERISCLGVCASGVGANSDGAGQPGGGFRKGKQGKAV